MKIQSTTNHQERNIKYEDYRWIHLNDFDTRSKP